jgi:hypothetical protein
MSIKFKSIQELINKTDPNQLTKADQWQASLTLNSWPESGIPFYYKEGDLNCEILLAAKNVTSHHCECSEWNLEIPCFHIVGLLIGHLNFKESSRKVLKAPKNVTIKKPRAAPGTIKSLLEEVSLESLVDFVQDYARYHKPFALALKARFSQESNQSGTKTIDGTELFQTTLENVRKNNKITIRGKSQLLMVLRNLRFQAEHLLSEGDYPEIIELVTGVLPHAATAIRYMDKVDKEYQQEILLLITKLVTVGRKGAPEIVEKVWQSLITEGKKTIYYSVGIQEILLQAMPTLIKDEKDRKEWDEMLDSQIERTWYQDSVRASLILAKYEGLEMLKNPELAEEFMNAHLTNHGFLEYVVNKVLEKGDRERAIVLLRKALDQGLSKNARRIVEEHLLDLTVSAGKKSEAIQMAKTLFLQGLDLKYLSLLSQLIPDSPTRKIEFDPILNIVRDMPYSLAKRDAMASLLKELERPLDLLEWVAKIKSLDLIMKYGDWCHQHLPKDTERLISQLLIEYARQNMGKEAAIKIKLTLMYLFEINLFDYSKELKNTLATEFSGRVILIEELNLLSF